MTATTRVSMTGTLATPAEVGVKHIRCGLGLFIFGLVIGYVPLAHYMHSSFEQVHEAFLKNVTLWWGYAFTLAVYVAQVCSLVMIVIGLCYVVFAQDGRMTSLTGAERMPPALCAGGIIAEFLAGFAGYYAVAAVWPNFYYTPIAAGKITWLALQAICIAIYVAGVMCANAGIKRATHALTAHARDPLRA